MVAADINDDGFVELLAADTRGSIAAFTWKGKEIWEHHIRSLIAQGPTVGDVDGDGRTEVVVPTSSGSVYVMRGKDGSPVAPFPYRTHGRVMSPVMITQLIEGAKQKHLVVSSFDGYLYVMWGEKLSKSWIHRDFGRFPL